MLDRETCEKLARAYPKEIGARDPYGEGDLWYVHWPIGGWSDEALPALNGGIYDFTEGEPCFVWGWSDPPVWCPHLGDLLAIIAAHVGTATLRHHAGEWEFSGYVSGKWRIITRPTPEDAVAAALLALKGEIA